MIGFREPGYLWKIKEVSFCLGIPSEGGIDANGISARSSNEAEVV